MIPMPAPFKATFTGGLMTAVIFGAFALSATGAGAIGLRTKIACARDYRAYCSSFKPGSNELRQCMNVNGAQLSKRCVDALVADGEISEAEIARRAANLR